MPNGVKSRELMAKLTPADLHPDVFGLGMFRRSRLGQVAAAFWLENETDFVVVTHNRATIEVADTIYGVTMTDAAVSRVLSLRLADLPVEALIG